MNNDSPTVTTENVTINPIPQTGWICPVCGAGVSPNQATCPCNGYGTGYGTQPYRPYTSQPWPYRYTSTIPCTWNNTSGKNPLDHQTKVMWQRAENLEDYNISCQHIN